MNKILTFSVGMFTSVNVLATPFTGTHNLASFDTDDVVINDGAVINAFPENSPIIITQHTTYITNNGQINGDIDINDKYVVIMNSGEINGRMINTGTGAVTQIIENQSQLTKIDFVGDNFYIEVNNFDGADFTKIKNTDAQHFTINNSGIVIENFADWQNWDKDITLSGINKLYLNNSYTVNSGEYIRNVTWTDAVEVIVTDADKLHKTRVTPTISGVILDIIRETDYTKVFDDKRGVLLENLRAANSNDNLLLAMDNANNMPELESVMNSSYRFNSSLLLNPIKTINNFIGMDMIQSETPGVGIVPFYITSDNITGFGVRGYVSEKYKDILYYLGVSATNFKWKENINDFNGIMYGVDVKIKKYIDNLWMIGAVNYSFTDFDADYIYHDNDITNNPHGVYMNGMFDVGYDLKCNDFVVSPFGGISFNDTSVLNNTDTNFNIHGGGNIRYSFIMDGIKYSYDAIGAVNGDGVLYGTLKFGFTSLQDRAGVTINISAINDDALSYKFSMNAKIMF